jgi:hypothetical protein
MLLQLQRSFHPAGSRAVVPLLLLRMLLLLPERLFWLHLTLRIMAQHSRSLLVCSNEQSRCMECSIPNLRASVVQRRQHACCP